MRYISALLAFAVTGALAVPTAPKSADPTDTSSLELSSVGPGFSILLAVETDPNGDKAIVSWAYGRSQCTERQLVSKAANFCDKKRTFNRVPNSAGGFNDGDADDDFWTQEKVEFLGCGAASKEGDYSGIVMSDGTSYFSCNNDRELHGCNYSGDEEADLTVFLSCGDYAYTADETVWPA